MFSSSENKSSGSNNSGRNATVNAGVERIEHNLSRIFPFIPSSCLQLLKMSSIRLSGSTAPFLIPRFMPVLSASIPIPITSAPASQITRISCPVPSTGFDVSCSSVDICWLALCCVVASFPVVWDGCCCSCKTAPSAAPSFCPACMGPVVAALSCFVSAGSLCTASGACCPAGTVIRRKPLSAVNGITRRAIKTNHNTNCSTGDILFFPNCLNSIMQQKMTAA